MFTLPVNRARTALLATLALIAMMTPVAYAVTASDSACVDGDPTTVELTFGTAAENEATNALLSEVRSRLGLNPDGPRNLRTASTAVPDWSLDTTGLPNLCLNWSVYGFPNGEGLDSSGNTQNFGRPFSEQYLVATTQAFVPGDSGVVSLRALLDDLPDPGCDLQTDLYIGETLGDDEQGAPHDDGGTSRDGLDRANVLIAYGTGFNSPEIPCGSAPVSTSTFCVEETATLVATVEGTTEDGLYELEVDGVVTDAIEYLVPAGVEPQLLELTSPMASGPVGVRVLLNGEPLVVDGPEGQRIVEPSDDDPATPEGVVTVEGPLCPDTPQAIGAIGDLVFADLDADGVQGDDEPGVEGVNVTLTDCALEPLATTVTDADGQYLFGGLLPGCYRVSFIAPEGTSFTSRDVGDDALDSDADRATGTTGEIDLLEGEVDLTVDAGIVEATVDIVTTTYAPQPTGGDDVCAVDKPVRIVLEYVGDTETVISGQDPSKGYATGSVGALPALVTSQTGDAAVSGDPYFDAVGDTVVVVGTKGGGNFGSATPLTVGGQAVEFHTSCSQPLLLGDQYGSVRLVAFDGDSGATGSLEPALPELGADGITATVGAPVTWNHVVTNPGRLSLTNVVVTDDAGTPDDPSDDLVATYVEGDTDGDGLLDPEESWLFTTSGTALPGTYENVGTVVADAVGTNGEVLVSPVTATDPTSYVATFTGEDLCDTYGKPAVFTFLYTGANIVDTAQDPSKAYADPTVIDAPEVVAIRVSDGGNEVYFSGIVALGDTFTATAAAAGQSRFNNQVFVELLDPATGGLLQLSELHASCSQPLAIGDQFGNVQLLGFGSEAGESTGVTPAAGGDGSTETGEPLVTAGDITVADRVRLPLTNDGTGDAVIESIQLTFPHDATGHTHKIRLDGTDIHDVKLDGPTVLIGSADFKNSVADRTITAGSASVLEFEFHDPADRGLGYAVTVTFTDGSSVQASDAVEPGSVVVSTGEIMVGDRMRVALSNDGSTRAVIESIELTFPHEVTGHTHKVRLNGTDIHDVKLDGPTATMGPGDFKNSVADRTIAAGSIGVLEFEFHDHADRGTGYAVSVTFTDGTTVTVVQ